MIDKIIRQIKATASGFIPEDYFDEGYKDGLYKAIEIVQEVAKECDTASDNDLMVVSALPSLYPLQKFEEEAIHKVVASAKDGGWIPVEVAMPEEHESIFAKYKGTSKWDENGMFEKISDEVYATVENMKTGESTTTHAHTTDGKWSCDLLRWNDTYRIIAWMPLPPKYEPKEATYQKGE